MNWKFIGYDVWRIIFCLFSFEERLSLRIICKDWNTLILPLTFSKENDECLLYSSMVKTLSTKVVKETKNQLKHKHMLMNQLFRFGIVLLGQGDYIKQEKETLFVYKGFSIYSKSNLELFYHYNEHVHHLHASKEAILVQDTLFNYWLFEFNDSLNCKKTKLFKADHGSYGYFSYPYLTFTYFHYKMKPKLIDVRTQIDVLEQNKIQIPEGFETHSINDDYFFINNPCTGDIWCYKLADLKASPLKITNESRGKVFFDRDMVFISPALSIDCYHLKTAKKTTKILSDLFVFMEVNKRFIDLNLKQTFRWNHDYTDFTFWSKEIHGHSYTYLFHSFLPFSAFLYRETLTIVLVIYSNKTKSSIYKREFPKDTEILIEDYTNIIYCISDREIVKLDFS